MSHSTLTTQRLHLRPFGNEDILPFHKILNEPDLLRYFPSSIPPSLEQTEKMVKRLLAHWDEHGYGIWAVEVAATGEFLGRCGLFKIAETGETEVDFIFATACWNQGYATEAGLAALRFGFEQVGLAAIIGIVHPENLASQRVLAKIGMRVTRADNYFGMDCFRYEITKEEFGEVAEE